MCSAWQAPWWTSACPLVSQALCACAQKAMGNTPALAALTALLLPSACSPPFMRGARRSDNRLCSKGWSRDGPMLGLPPRNWASRRQGRHRAGGVREPPCLATRETRGVPQSAWVPSAESTRQAARFFRHVLRCARTTSQAVSRRCMRPRRFSESPQHHIADPSPMPTPGHAPLMGRLGTP